MNSENFQADAVDPRIALLTQQDRRLLMVGNGTMGMMLAAAEKAGIIPAGTVTTEYGALRTPADHVYPQHDADGALDQARLMDDAADGHTYEAVSRTRTTFADVVSEWTPVLTEENHA